MVVVGTAVQLEKCFVDSGESERAIVRVAVLICLCLLLTAPHPLLHLPHLRPPPLQHLFCFAVPPKVLDPTETWRKRVDMEKIC